MSKSPVWKRVDGDVGVTEDGETFKTKNLPSHPEIVSSKQIRRIACLDTSTA